MAKRSTNSDTKGEHPSYPLSATTDEGLAQERLNNYLQEPLRDGNILVMLPDRVAAVDKRTFEAQALMSDKIQQTMSTYDKTK